MATEYNQVIVNDIDITETYKKLMKASVGQDSAYIGTNTTISVGVCTGYSSNNMNAGIKVYVPTGTESY